MLSHHLLKNRVKRIFALIVANIFIISTMRATPLVSIGDNADIYFDGSSTARWTSNVFLTDLNEVDDFVYILSPGFEFNVGRDVSNADLSIITRYDIVRYNDLSDLDVGLLHLKLRGAYKTSRLELEISANYDEQKSNSGDAFRVDDLIESDISGAVINGEYTISPKFSIGLGARYTKHEYTGPFERILADQDTKVLPLDIFYELTPKMDLSLGYIYSETEVGALDPVAFDRSGFDPITGLPLIDSVTGLPLIDPSTGLPTLISVTTRQRDTYSRETHFFNIGARGSLLPKLSGFLKAGYRIRESGVRTFTDVTEDLLNNTEGPPVDGTRRFSEERTLGLDADLYWRVTPKFATRFGLSRDFGVGSDGAPLRISSFSLSSDLSLNNNYTASANLGYMQRDYTFRDREDDKYSAGIRIFYTPNAFWQYNLGYTFIDNLSTGTEAGNSYDADVVDLNATLRY